MRSAFWTCLALTAALYAVMAAWSLPWIAGQAGGLRPFDMRPTGYDLDDARAFVAALSVEGREFYAGVQHWLDLIYPPLLALTCVLGYALIFPVRWVGLLAGVAVLGMAADWTENWMVARMLAAPAPADLDAGLVARAQAATLVKSAANTLCFLALAVAGVRGLGRRMRR